MPTKKPHHGLTAYYQKKMNETDIAEWVEKNKEKLIQLGLLTIQQNPDNPEKEIWFLKFER